MRQMQLTAMTETLIYIGADKANLSHLNYSTRYVHASISAGYTETFFFKTEAKGFFKKR